MRTEFLDNYAARIAERSELFEGSEEKEAATRPVHVAVVYQPAVASMANPGPHGFSEVLYAYTSQTGNNGSAFAGLNANTPFFNTTIGLAMLLGRFFTMLPMLAVAGSLAAKKNTPAATRHRRTAGTASAACSIMLPYAASAAGGFAAWREAGGPIADLASKG